MAEEIVHHEAIQQYIGQLATLEKEFDALEVQIRNSPPLPSFLLTPNNSYRANARLTTTKNAKTIVRDTYNRHFPLFQKRDAITSQIRGFWPLVFEQASSMLSFDEHITTEDGHLLSSLRSMTLSRPDVDNEPRTICLSFTFEENDFFEDTVLAKTFVFGKGGEMSSVPVGIKWKDGKDLTEGVSATAVQAWEERKSGKKDGEGMKKLGELMKKGPSSFFNWFEWTGKHDSLGEVKDEEDDGDEEGDEDEGDDDGIVEVFPNGDELAIQLGEDVYPNAPKYFSALFPFLGKS